MSLPNNTNDDLAIKDEAVRYIWAGWYILVIISSFFGDTIILIASIKYRAIKLPGVLVAFIQHIAVFDLAICITSSFPSSVSLIRNKWIFGDVLCYLRPYCNYFVYQAGMFLVCGMTVCKLLILKFPLRSFTWTAGQAHKVCGIMWLLALYWPICYLLVDKDDVSFDYRSYACKYGFSSELWRFLEPVGMAIFYFAPNFVIVVAAVMILVVAKRATAAREGMKWQGVMTVVLTVAAYTISFLPMAVYHILKPFVEKDPSKPGPFKISYYRVSFSFLTINVIANFYIYCLAITSFKEFLRLRTKRIIFGIRNTFKTQGMLLL